MDRIVFRRTTVLRTAILAVFISLGLFSGQSQPVAADGLSVSPAPLGFGEVLRGGDVLRTILVENMSDSEKDFEFQRAGAMAPWMTIVDPADKTKVLERITIPATSKGGAFVRLRVPSETANGAYKGAISVYALSKLDPTSRTSQSAVHVGVEIEVSASVTGAQRIEAALLEVTVEDTEVGTPLVIKSKINNLGNVQVTPEIRGTFVNDKAVTVGEKKFEFIDPIPPGEAPIVRTEWDTANALPGRYTATVKFGFGGLDLGTRDLSFTVLQPGTLTRQGKLEDLKLANKPDAGGTAKFEAKLSNTGRIKSKVIVVGELYKGQTLVRAVTSQERVIPAGELGSTEMFVEGLKKGAYVLKAKANFEGKESETRELKFSVGKAAIGSDLPVLEAAVLLAIASAAASLIVLRRKRTTPIHVAPSPGESSGGS